MVADIGITIATLVSSQRTMSSSILRELSETHVSFISKNGELFCYHVNALVFAFAILLRKNLMVNL